MLGKAAMIAVLLTPTASIARHADHRTAAKPVRWFNFAPSCRTADTRPRRMHWFLWTRLPSLRQPSREPSDHEPVPYRQAKNALKSKFHCLRIGIERKQLLRMRDAAQRVAPHRNEAALDVSHVGERRRHQNGLIDRTAHCGAAACLVHRRPNDGEIQPFAAS